jgi:serine/threonine protein kinase
MHTTVIKPPAQQLHPAFEGAPIFEELLLKLKTVTFHQFQEAKEEAKHQGAPVSQILAQKKYISSDELKALNIIQQKYLDQYKNDTSFRKKRLEQIEEQRRRGKDRRQGDRRREGDPRGRRVEDQLRQQAQLESSKDPLYQIFRSSDLSTKYEIIEEISRGGMGIVYKAKDVDLQRIVAIKVIRDDQEPKESQRIRFQVEAEILASLCHPYIVQIHDTGNSQGVKYLVMEYIDGLTLEEYLQDESCLLTPKVVIELMIKISKAVAYMHEKNILHRDLKPSNIMIDRYGDPHLMDFGLAKDLKRSNKLTQCGMTMGTPSYISPEQALGDSANLGPRSDLYSLGGILYELLTLHPPFQGNNVLYVLNQVLYEEVRRPRLYNSNISLDLEAICLKALAKKPEKRYSSAQEFSEDLQCILNGQALSKNSFSSSPSSPWFSNSLSFLFAVFFLVIVYWFSAPKESPILGQKTMLKGFEFYLKNNPLKALEYADEAIHNNPQDPSAYWVRSHINYQMGDLSQALQDIEKFLALGGSPQLGDVLLKKWRLEYHKEQSKETTIPPKNF